MELQSYFYLLIISVVLLHVSSVQMSYMEVELYEFVPLGAFIIYNVYFVLMTFGLAISMVCLLKIYTIADRQVRESRII